MQKYYRFFSIEFSRISGYNVSSGIMGLSFPMVFYFVLEEE